MCAPLIRRVSGCVKGRAGGKGEAPLVGRVSGWVGAELVVWCWLH